MLEVRITVTLGERWRVVTGRGRKGTSGLLSCSIYQVTWACSPVDHLLSYMLVISELSECATLQQKKVYHYLMQQEVTSIQRLPLKIINGVPSCLSG